MFYVMAHYNRTGRTMLHARNTYATSAAALCEAAGLELSHFAKMHPTAPQSALRLRTPGMVYVIRTITDGMVWSQGTSPPQPIKA